MNAIKDGSTDADVMAKWPDSPEWWGFKEWKDIGPYALGHGLGVSLHDRPFFNQQNVHAGMKPQKFQEGMCIAVEFYTGKKDSKNGVRLEENILVTKGGYELLSLWPVQELMECWLLLDKAPWRLYADDAGREISSLAASALYFLEPLLGLGKRY